MVNTWTLPQDVGGGVGVGEPGAGQGDVRAVFCRRARRVVTVRSGAAWSGASQR